MLLMEDRKHQFTNFFACKDRYTSIFITPESLLTTASANHVRSEKQQRSVALHLKNINHCLCVLFVGMCICAHMQAASSRAHRCSCKLARTEGRWRDHNDKEGSPHPGCK